jgi:hypothetical protein
MPEVAHQLTSFGIDSVHATGPEAGFDVLFCNGILTSVNLMRPARATDDVEQLIVGQLGGWIKNVLYPSGTGFILWRDSKTALEAVYVLEPGMRHTAEAVGDVQYLELIDLAASRVPRKACRSVSTNDIE